MKTLRKVFDFIKDPPVWFAAVWYVLTAALIAASIAMTVLKYDSSPAVVTIYFFFGNLFGVCRLFVGKPFLGNEERGGGQAP